MVYFFKIKFYKNKNIFQNFQYYILAEEIDYEFDVNNCILYLTRKHVTFVHV